MKNTTLTASAKHPVSLNKLVYQRDELIEELCRFEDEIISITFDKENNDDHIKMYDALDYLAARNDQCYHIADRELEIFKNEALMLHNYLRKQMSGQKGENIIFRALTHLNNQDIVLKNIEISDGNRSTEIDALVISPKGITIIEVKNTHRDIFIDPNGNYFRTGEFLRYDSPVGEKMKFRESLIKQKLAQAGFSDIPVKSLLVFTNRCIQIQNKCPWIKTCFAANLVSSIDDNYEKNILNSVSMETIRSAITTGTEKKAYPLPFDVEQIRSDFTALLDKLNQTPTKHESIWSRALGALRKMLRHSDSELTNGSIALSH